MFNGSEHYDKEFQGPLERAGATGPQRHHQRGPHQLLRRRAHLGARPRALARERPDGAPGRRDQPGQARRAARRGAEREARGRERALRQGVGLPHAQALPRQPSVLLDHHRLDGGPRRGQARRREGLVPDLLRPGERRAGASPATSTSKTAKEKVERYFGDIPPGPPIARQGAWIAKRTRQPARHDAGPRAADAASTRSGTCRSGARRTATTCRSPRRC